MVQTRLFERVDSDVKLRKAITDAASEARLHAGFPPLLEDVDGEAALLPVLPLSESLAAPLLLRDEQVGGNPLGRRVVWVVRLSLAANTALLGERPE